MLNQMSERLCQLEQENNKMCKQNLQYKHQIEARINKQTPSSSRFYTNIRSMPSLKTLNEKIANIQANGAWYNLTNDEANQNQEELVAPSANVVHPSKLSAINVLLPSNTHEAELQH